jgi:hypothetical protein
MSLNEKATATVSLDGSQVQAELDQIESKIRDVKKSLATMKTGDFGFKKHQQELAGLEKELAKTQKGTFDLNRTLRNLSGATLRDLRRAKSALAAQIQHLSRDTEEGRKKFMEKTEALKRVNAEIKGVSGQMWNYKKESSQGVFKQIRMGWIAIAAGIATVFRSFQRFAQARDEELRRTAELQNALQGEEDVTRRLIRVAGELQRTRGVSDEDVKSQMAFLALQGRSEKQIENTVKAAIELSNVMGVSLSQAVQTLDGTFEGNLARLTRLDRGFRDLTQEQLAAGAAVDLINQKFGGQAEAAFNAGLGPLRAYRLAWGDLQKTLGAFVVNTLNPVFQAMTDRVNRFNKTLNDWTKNANEKFSEQLDRVTDLETGITPLLARYDELAGKSNLSTAEQTELNRIIEDIAKTIPSAVSRFNEYGDAIEISTSRAREFIDVERDRLRVINQSAIQQTQQEINKRETLLKQSVDRMKQIEERGVFDIIEYHYTKTGTLYETRRDANNEEIAQQIQHHQTLSSELRGYQAELNRLTGDYLLDAQKRREEEANATREAEERKAEYMRMPIQELQKIASEGDELAQRVLATRQQETQSVREAAGAYAQLTGEIQKLRREQQELVAEGKFDAAGLLTANINNLENQKLIVDGILAAGGNVHDFLNSITSDTEATTEELQQIRENVLKIIEDEQTAREQAIEQRRQMDDFDWEARHEALLKEIETERDLNKQLQDDIRDMEAETQEILKQLRATALAESFNLFAAYSAQRRDQELADLRARRDHELSNKELTDEERLRLEERFQAEEARIKLEAFKKQRAADVIESLINGALAVTRALAVPPGFPLNAPLVAAAASLAAAQTAVIAAQPVPQFASGRYATVMGQNDGKLYRAELAGRPRTGIYKNPTLISEEGGELIIDAPTTRHLQLNYPDIIAGIMANRVPQYATGRYPAEPAGRRSTGSANQNTPDVNALLEQIYATMEENAAAMHRSNVLNQQLLNQLSRGIESEVSLFSLKKALDDSENLENLTKY